VKVKIIDPTIDHRWDEFVDSQENSTIYHTSAWARVIKEAYGYLPRYYVIENEDGHYRAAISFFRISSILTGKRLVSLPFSDYCWPLGKEEADITLLLEASKKEVETNAATYLEIRGWQENSAIAHTGLVAHNYHLVYLLDLEPDIKAIQAKFHDNVRRGIQQSEKRGVTAHLASSEEDMDRFYRLHVTTRKKLGVLPQPHRFFKSLFRHVISQNLGFIGLAECEGKTIAGVVFLTHGNTLYYKFNASDNNFLQRRPNHLVTWKAINYALANQYQCLDFGRCSPEEEGLRTYKSRWGSREVNLPYYFYPAVKGFTNVTEDSPRYKTMRLFSHMVPQSVFTMAGSLLYKHLG
jgi:lipid II:glycine glycyltransferase (peptidoglycan interpeptide bridge formation enzyme)